MNAPCNEKLASTRLFPEDCPTTSLVLERIVEGSALCAGDIAHERLLTDADAAGFLPVLYRYLLSTGRDVPGRFRQSWLVHIARLALYRAELRRVLPIIEAFSPVVLLKGEGLSLLLFGDARLRNTTDMDLLIDPRQLGPIVEALGEIGYHTLGDGKTKPWAYNQLLLVHEDCGTLIELHWRIAFPHLKSPPIGDLLEDTIAVELDGGALPARSLRPELLLLQLCFHFHQHHGFYKGLLDIAGWIDRFESTADLDEVRALTRRYEIDGVLQWGLHALERFTGVRSRLYDPHANLFAKSWAAWSALEMERRYIFMASPNAIDRWWRDPRVTTQIAGVLADALSMTVADGALNRLRAVLSPVLLGPHRVGRVNFAILEGIGAFGREELYERRILG
ncbi:nucleotidyltransferase family protein [Bradymonas sediminis]|uniref:Uncharacterized protein n=1 Tax=Bradymonas sediminis TaxID=1548548 RepID=A0A2Z4FGB5_9DELT|nr:nucleotidyltransferase family protein [Bradymonas sediminis]AWV87977.1 hypothetical protein DN745_00980 [Bradymonas sediminis]TDP62997.1 putative nucleotidyltransferase-like protein [Bradymonas sediminis]